MIGKLRFTLFLATILIARTAAAEPTRVRYRASDCEPSTFDRGEFVDILRAELLGDGVTELLVEKSEATSEHSRSVDDSLAEISLEKACSLEPTLVVDDAATDKSVQRSIDLREVPREMRARTLALAMAELIHASWAELVLPKSPPPRAPVPQAVVEAARSRVAPASPQATSPPRPAPRPTFLSMGAETRLFFTDGLPLFGASASLSMPIVRPPFRLRFFGGGWTGRRSSPLGVIGLNLATGGVSPSLGVGDGRLDLEIGPGLELGAATASGTASASHVAQSSGAAFVATASVAAHGSFRLVSSLWATADLGFGEVLSGAEARVDGAPFVGVRGAIGSGRLGLALSF